MMVGPISSSRASGVSQVGRVGGSGTSSKAGQAMSNVAGRVASTLTDEFDLLDQQGGSQSGESGYQGDEDIYGIGDTARELNSELGGSGADEGQLARILGAFAFESASLIGARPESRSLERIEQAIKMVETKQQGIENIQSVLASIEDTTKLVASQARLQ